MGVSLDASEYLCSILRVQDKNSQFNFQWKYGYPIPKDDEIRLEAESILLWLFDGIPIEMGISYIPPDMRFTGYCDATLDWLAGFICEFSTAWRMPAALWFAGVHITVLETLAVALNVELLGRLGPP